MLTTTTQYKSEKQTLESQMGEFERQKQQYEIRKAEREESTEALMVIISTDEHLLPDKLNKKISHN